MKHEDGKFNGHDGLELYWQSWVPEEKATAALLLAHGHGEHSGRYSYSVQRLLADGIAVYALDHRGHGKSGGQRGHIDSMGDYRDDLGLFKSLVDAKSPDVPLFLYGHSMGSVIVLDYIMRNQGGFQGLITSGVGLEPGQVAPKWQVLMAKVLSIFWPTYSLNINVAGKDLSRDPAEINDYDNDPDVHHQGSARWAAEMLKANDWIRDNPAAVQLPLFMQHGGADKVNLPSGSTNFSADVSKTNNDVSLKLYPGNLHVIHGDLDKAKVLTDLVDWIKARS